MYKHLKDLVCKKAMKNFVVLIFLLPICLSQKSYGNSINLVKLPDQYQQKWYSSDYGYPEYPNPNPGYLDLNSEYTDANSGYPEPNPGYSAYPGYPPASGYPSGYYSSGYPDPPSKGKRSNYKVLTNFAILMKYIPDSPLNTI